MSTDRPAAVVCLAAGASTRMRSSTPKVLHPLGGRTLLGHALHAAGTLSPRHVVVVVRRDRDAVAAHARALLPDVVIADQDEVPGTGRAAWCGLAALPADLDGTVVVTMGDVPLLAGDTLAALVAVHRDAGAVATVLTSTADDPTGYGRVLRDPDGAVREIVEQRDATPEQAAVTEINAGVYAFDAATLRAALGRLSTDNAQGEQYLTDVVALARADGGVVAAHRVDDGWQTEGVNDRVQLARLGAELNRRTVQGWMRAGVSVVDPSSTWIDVTVRLAPDVTLLPGTQLHGSTSSGPGAAIGPDSTLTDVEVGAGASVVRTHAVQALVGDGASVGPFAYLRPGTRLGARAKAGTFVELKNSELGEGAKVPHLSYVGDASVGEGSNLGAGTITANYDGQDKHRTVVGAQVRIGVDTMLVAPVRVGDGALTGAGAVVRTDVPPGTLAVSAGEQRHLSDWVARKRPGSAADLAARRAVQGGTGGGAQSSQTPGPNEEHHA